MDEQQLGAWLANLGTGIALLLSILGARGIFQNRESDTFDKLTKTIIAQNNTIQDQSVQIRKALNRISTVELELVNLRVENTGLKHLEEESVILRKEVALLQTQLTAERSDKQRLWTENASLRLELAQLDAKVAGEVRTLQSAANYANRRVEKLFSYVHERWGVKISTDELDQEDTA